MLVPITVYVHPELLHEVEIQALREGLDLDIVTGIGFEEYLAMAYSDERLREIHGEERFKEIETEVEKLEKEWEPVSKMFAMAAEAEFAEWEKEMQKRKKLKLKAKFKV